MVDNGVNLFHNIFFTVRNLDYQKNGYKDSDVTFKHYVLYHVLVQLKTSKRSGPLENDSFLHGTMVWPLKPPNGKSTERLTTVAIVPWNSSDMNMCLLCKKIKNQ